MNKPVRTKTPAGDDIVMLPAADYERLLELAENGADIRLVEQELARLAAGESEALTASETLELLDAPSPIGFWRKRRDLTQVSLAKAVGISQAYLAQIESAKRTGEINVYRRLAETLRVDIEELLSKASAGRVGRKVPKKTKRRRRK